MSTAARGAKADLSATAVSVSGFANTNHSAFRDVYRGSSQPLHVTSLHLETTSQSVNENPPSLYTRLAMWPHNASIAWSRVVAIFVVSCATVSAQELSFAVSLDGSRYGGDAYDMTDGDRAGEIAFGYQTARGIHLAGGVFVGKFDEPVSDQSFTAINAFLEPSVIFRRTARVRPVVGARLAWEHQRVGDQSNGLWAYGWGVAGVAGVLVKLGEAVSLGVRTVLSGLNIERENGASRNGVRFQLGGTFVLTWPLR